MSDFVTTLAERAMGAAALVRPLLASRFAPEPSHWLEPASEDEPGTSPEGPDQTPSRGTREPPPARNAPRLVPDETVTAINEERDTIATPPTSETPAASPLDPRPSRGRPSSGQEDRGATPGTPDPRQRQRGAGGPGPPESGAGPAQAHQENLSSALPKKPVARAPEPGSKSLRPSESGSSKHEAMTEKSPRNPARTTVVDALIPPPAPRFDTTDRVEPAPTRRGADRAPRRLVAEGSSTGSFAAEDGPGQSGLRKTTVLAGRGGDAAGALAPTSGTADESSGSATVLARRATPGAGQAIVPSIVRPQPDRRREDGPWEPQVLAPEPPAPTIKVAIGRIEVRAVTPPPTPPAQRETPARPGPLLSLDDYLEQRNGGRP